MNGIYKPHPNELKVQKIFIKIITDYPKVIYLDTNVGHQHIIAQKPKCIVQTMAQ